ncbi:MAG: DUF418 domain-containing protein, partial [Planctomycetota bacterium]|nr:DUF418 domain-containing protein [Planctomycetota bacterium]
MTSEIPLATAIPVTPPPDAGPVKAADRIATIDVIRGVAVLGILMVNIQYFAFPFEFEGWRLDRFHGFDKLTRLFVSFFAEAKFITMFSTLFGMGLALQSERANAAGRPFAGLYSRRLVFLYLFGLCHGLLLWYGDILFCYAILGFLALLCRNLNSRTLIIIAIPLFLLPAVTMSGFAAREPDEDWNFEFGDVEPDEQVASATHGGDSSDIEKALIRILKDEERTYREGTWGEIATVRALQYLLIVGPFTFAFFGTRTLAVFMFGMVFIKLGLFDGTDQRRGTLRWLLLIGLIVGLPMQAVATYFLAFGDSRAIIVATQTNAMWFGSAGLCLAYMSGLALFCMNPIGLRLLRPVAAVGQMALTNYLTHSIVFTT